MNEEIVLKRLYQLNEWWVSGTVPASKLESFRRKDLHFIVQNMKQDDNILTIIGPRRVGKTTMLYQSIDTLIQEETDPKNIVFITADDDLLKLNTTDLVNDCIEVYEKNILGNTIAKLSQKIYVIIDEIQYYDNWNIKLKNWYDMKYKIKFVLSGSSSVNILTGTSESLTGRMLHQIVMPLKFSEILRHKLEKEKILFTFSVGLTRKAFLDSISQKNPSIIFEKLKEETMKLIPIKEKIEIVALDYAKKGGYPLQLKMEDESSYTKQMQTYLDSTLYKDIVRLFEIRDPGVLHLLLTIVAGEGVHGSTIEAYSSELGKRKETIQNYLNYLEKAFLISKSPFYSKNMRTRERNPKKIYISDTGIRNTILNQGSARIAEDPAEMGKIVQTVVHDHAKRLKFNLESGALSTTTYYWKKDKEVDIVIEINQKPIPIEVKYSNSIDKSDISGLISFQKKFKNPFGIVITKDRLELVENIIYIPYWLFMLLC